MLGIHMYNIINGIVGIKSLFFVKEGYQIQSFLEALKSVIFCDGGVEVRDGVSRK